MILEIMNAGLPVYLVLPLMLVLLILIYHKKTDSKILTIFTTSFLTASFCLGLILFIFFFPQSVGMDTGDISFISTAISNSYYTTRNSMQNIEFFDPNSVQSLADKLYDDCNESESCFKWEAYTFVKNKIGYEYDFNLYGKREYRATPLQTLAMGKGDCDDQSGLLASLLRNKIKEVYIMDLPRHFAVGVCENETLIRYDATMSDRTGNTFNEKAVEGYYNTTRYFSGEMPDC